MSQKIVGLALLCFFIFSCQSTTVRHPSSAAYEIKAGQVLNCDSHQYTLTFSQNFKQGEEQDIEVNPGGDLMMTRLKFTKQAEKTIATAHVEDCPDEKTQCWKKDIYFDANSITAAGKLKAVFVDFYNGKKLSPETVACSILSNQKTSN